MLTAGGRKRTPLPPSRNSNWHLTPKGRGRDGGVEGVEESCPVPAEKVDVWKLFFLILPPGTAFNFHRLRRWRGVILLDWCTTCCCKCVIILSPTHPLYEQFSFVFPAPPPRFFECSNLCCYKYSFSRL